MSDVVVGVDIGTTSSKAVAFTTGAEAVGSGRAGYPLLARLPGYAEGDAPRAQRSFQPLALGASICTTDGAQGYAAVAPVGWHSGCATGQQRRPSLGERVLAPPRDL